MIAKNQRQGRKTVKNQVRFIFAIVAAVLFGMLVLGELPDPWTFAGIALIVLAGLYVLGRGR